MKLHKINKNLKGCREGQLPLALSTWIFRMAALWCVAPVVLGILILTSIVYRVNILIEKFAMQVGQQ